MRWIRMPNTPPERPPFQPKTSSALLFTFAAYSKWYIGRNFNAVRLSKSGGVPATENVPMVVYLNHAAWWDPLIGLLLAKTLWSSRQHFAPIDAIELARYPILSRIGFFGVEVNTPRGAATFLKTSLAILDSPSAAIWITSEGQFRDPRTRPVELRAGLAHLARRINSASIVPLAIEYPFWEERFPEVLCRFGQPVEPPADGRDIAAWTARLTDQMRINQDKLAGESIARRTDDFQTILRGRAGVSAIYDAYRWTLAKLKGESFHRRHGERSS
jgi:1-acyl-sn-glycerol-3-phosphate acyltransferase